VSSGVLLGLAFCLLGGLCLRPLQPTSWRHEAGLAIVFLGAWLIGRSSK